MAGEFSFDIVSDFDRQELVNAVDQTHREMQQRYDLKSAKGTLELEKDTIVVMAPSEMTRMSLRIFSSSVMTLRPLSASRCASSAAVLMRSATLRTSLEMDSSTLRYGYTSLVTPASVLDLDLDSGERVLVKQQPVLGGYDATRYETRLSAFACRKATPVVVCEMDAPNESVRSLST